MDSVFLTLSVCVLQVYVGMRCTDRAQACLAHRGFDFLLCAGVRLPSASKQETNLLLQSLLLLLTFFPGLKVWKRALVAAALAPCGC